MIIKNKKLIFLILFFNFFILLPLTINAIGAGSVADVQGSLDRTAEYAEIDTDTTVYQIVGYIINLILGFLGALFLLLIIFGGITWMTAAGNQEKSKKPAP